MSQQTEQQRQATFKAAGMQPAPAAQAPVTPAPTLSTPAIGTTQAPAGWDATTYANFKAANPTLEPNAEDTARMQSAGTTALPTMPGGASTPLQMPATGSVIDLLNMAGQDSSKDARKALAQQYGIQSYDFSADKNKELADKFLAAYNAKKGTAVPESSAEARDALNTFQDTTEPTKADPQATFFDAYAGMNPVVKTLYDNLNNLLSSTGTRQTFKEEFEKLRTEQGVPALQTELMNLKNLMDGTDDSIRDEIAKAGGFATENQVQALAIARNKTWLRQAKDLQDQLQMKNDYIDHVMRLSGADRDQVEKDIDRKLGITEKVAELQEKMITAAKDNYQKVVDNLGYQGLANALQGDERAMQRAETALGLSSGALSSQVFLKTAKPSSGSATSIQEYEYAKAQGYKGSYIDYQNDDANRKKSIAAAGIKNEYGMTPRETAIFNSIVDKQNKSPLVAAHDRVVILRDVTNALEKDPLNASLQVSFIYSMIQALDTYQSAVREGEIGLISGTQGVGEKIQNLPSKIAAGNPLGKKKIEEYVNTARLLVQSISSAAETKRKSFNEQAKVAGIGDAFNEYQNAVYNSSDSYASYRNKLQPNEILVKRNGKIGAVSQKEVLSTDEKL